jgi:pilus assembly protein FimV
VLTVACPLVVADVKACDIVVEDILVVDDVAKDDTAIDIEVVAADDVKGARLEVCCALDELITLVAINEDVIPVGLLLEEGTTMILDEEEPDNVLDDEIAVLLGNEPTTLVDEEVAKLPDIEIDTLLEDRMLLEDNDMTLLLVSDVILVVNSEGPWDDVDTAAPDKIDEDELAIPENTDADDDNVVKFADCAVEDGELELWIGEEDGVVGVEDAAKLIGLEVDIMGELAGVGVPAIDWFVWLDDWGVPRLLKSSDDEVTLLGPGIDEVVMFDDELKEAVTLDDPRPVEPAPLELGESDVEVVNTVKELEALADKFELVVDDDGGDCEVVNVAVLELVGPELGMFELVTVVVGIVELPSWLELKFDLVVVVWIELVVLKLGEELVFNGLEVAGELEPGCDGLTTGLELTVGLEIGGVDMLIAVDDIVVDMAGLELKTNEKLEGVDEPGFELLGIVLDELEALEDRRTVEVPGFEDDGEPTFDELKTMVDIEELENPVFELLEAELEKGDVLEEPEFNDEIVVPLDAVALESAEPEGALERPVELEDVMEFEKTPLEEPKLEMDPEVKLEAELELEKEVTEDPKLDKDVETTLEVEGPIDDTLDDSAELEVVRLGVLEALDALEELKVLRTLEDPEVPDTLEDAGMLELEELEAELLNILETFEIDDPEVLVVLEVAEALDTPEIVGTLEDTVELETLAEPELLDTLENPEVLEGPDVLDALGTDAELEKLDTVETTTELEDPEVFVELTGLEALDKMDEAEELDEIEKLEVPEGIETLDVLDDPDVIVNPALPEDVDALWVLEVDIPLEETEIVDPVVVLPDPVFEERLESDEKAAGEDVVPDLERDSQSKLGEWGYAQSDYRETGWREALGQDCCQSFVLDIFISEPHLNSNLAVVERGSSGRRP